MGNYTPWLNALLFLGVGAGFLIRFKQSNPNRDEIDRNPDSGEGEANIPPLAPVANALQLPDSQPAAIEKQRPSEKRYYTQDLGMFWLTLAGLAVLIVNTLYTRQTVTIAQDTAIRQLRAYLSVEPVGFECGDCGEKGDDLSLHQISPNNFGMNVKNGGQTPAYQVSVCASWSLLPLFTDLPANFSYACKPFGAVSNSNSIQVNTIGPDATQKVAIPIYAADLQEAKKQFSTLYGYGAIIYDDAYGVRRKTPFCFRYIPHEKGGLFATCVDTNQIAE